MAVYQAARPQSAFLSRRTARGDSLASPALPRRRIRGAVRAQRQGGRVGIILGGIVITFLLAFFWLAQTVGVSATSYDIDQRAAERDRLQAQVRDLQADLNRLGHEPAIRKQAIDAGFNQLGEAEELSAR